METEILKEVIIAVLIGFIPALIWFWIWKQEDSENPEPANLLLVSFLAGMLTAPIAAVIQLISKNYLIGEITFLGGVFGLYIIAWVIIEELLKFTGSLFALKSREFDEPIDAMVYLITTSLGFVAVENTLYALQSIGSGGLVDGYMNAFSRFIGPSLLHIITSAVVGLSISISFYMKRKARIVYIIIGLLTAIVLHTFYNFLIIINTDSFLVIAFTSVWILAILMLGAFEIVKKIKKQKIKNYG